MRHSASDYALFDGILLVNKPAGPTSHDIVHKIRRHFKIPKVGHGGTLDPGATGLLAILLGKGTKLSYKMLNSDKSYTGSARLGRVTDTQDADGTILSENPLENISREQVEQTIPNFTGDIFQTPPMVSAVKSGGIPLYKLARKGKSIERKPRLIHVFNFDLVGWSPPLFNFKIDCTQGTYIRTLIHDLGTGLGSGASLETLCRTRVGPFLLENATNFEDVLQCSEEQLAALVIPLHTAYRIC